MNTMTVTPRIKTEQRIRVDATNGAVFILGNGKRTRGSGTGNSLGEFYGV